MTHFEFRKTPKTALEKRSKKGTRTKTEEDSDKTATWRLYELARVGAIERLIQTFDAK